MVIFSDPETETEGFGDTFSSDQKQHRRTSQHWSGKITPGDEFSSLRVASQKAPPEKVSKHTKHGIYNICDIQSIFYIYI